MVWVSGVNDGLAVGKTRTGDALFGLGEELGCNVGEGLVVNPPTGGEAVGDGCWVVARTGEGVGVATGVGAGVGEAISAEGTGWVTVMVPLALAFR